MDVFIYTQEKDSSLTFENVKSYFSQEFSDKEFEWKCSNTMIATSFNISEKEIIKVFEELIKNYPNLNVEASYSYDVRENDRSAQWWGTTKIYSQKEDGEIKIVSSSSTYWN